MKKANTLNKTTESVFTLTSLFVLIEQSIQAITGNEEILDSEFDEKHNSFHHLVTDTIHEALSWQILIKTCAFLDEWNNVFGVLTEEGDKERILTVKRIAKPAHKQLSHWKQLKEFRNEMIAHNHRDKKGENVFLAGKSYHSPNTIPEVFLMCYCLKKMMDVLKFFFHDEMHDAVLKFAIVKDKKYKVKKPLSRTAIKKATKELDKAIDDKLASIAMRSAILESMFKGLTENT